MSSDEADQVSLVRQVTQADVALTDGAETAIDNLATAVVAAAQAQTDGDAPAVAAAIDASVHAQANALAADAKAQAAYTQTLTSFSVQADVLRATTNWQYDQTMSYFEGQLEHTEVAAEQSYNIALNGGPSATDPNLVFGQVNGTFTADWRQHGNRI